MAKKSDSKQVAEKSIPSPKSEPQRRKTKKKKKRKSGKPTKAELEEYLTVLMFGDKPPHEVSFKFGDGIRKRPPPAIVENDVIVISDTSEDEVPIEDNTPAETSARLLSQTKDKTKRNKRRSNRKPKATRRRKDPPTLVFEEGPAEAYCYRFLDRLYEAPRRPVRHNNQRFRGKDVQQTAEDRRSRREHPYTRPARNSRTDFANKYSTFDLAYRDLEDLMQCLTSRNFRRSGKQQLSMGKKETPREENRFASYQFSRSTMEDINIKDFEVRSQIADMAEELAEQSMSQLLESSGIMNEELGDDLIVLDEESWSASESPTLVPICSSTPGRLRNQPKSNPHSTSSNIVVTCDATASDSQDSVSSGAAIQQKKKLKSVVFMKPLSDVGSKSQNSANLDLGCGSKSQNSANLDLGCGSKSQNSANLDHQRTSSDKSTNHENGYTLNREYKPGYKDNGSESAPEKKETAAKEEIERCDKLESEIELEGKKQTEKCIADINNEFKSKETSRQKEDKNQHDNLLQHVEHDILQSSDASVIIVDDVSFEKTVESERATNVTKPHPPQPSSTYSKTYLDFDGSQKSYHSKEELSTNLQGISGSLQIQRNDKTLVALKDNQQPFSGLQQPMSNQTVDDAKILSSAQLGQTPCEPITQSSETGSKNLKVLSDNDTSSYHPQSDPTPHNFLQQSTSVPVLSKAELSPSQNISDKPHMHQTDTVELHPAQIPNESNTAYVQDSTKQESFGSVLPVKEFHMSVNEIDSKSAEKINTLLAAGSLKETLNIPSSQDNPIDNGHIKYARKSSDLNINTVSTFLADPAQYSHDVSLADKSLDQEGSSKDMSVVAQQSSPQQISTSDIGSSKDMSVVAQQSSPQQISTSDITSTLRKLTSLLSHSLSKPSTQTDKGTQATGSCLEKSQQQNKIGSEIKKEGNVQMEISPPPPPPPPLPSLSSKQKVSSTNKTHKHCAEVDYLLTKFKTDLLRDPRLQGLSKRQRADNRRKDALKSVTRGTIRVVRDIPLEPVENLKEQNVNLEKAGLASYKKASLSYEQSKLDDAVKMQKIGSVKSQQLASEAADSEEKITNGVAPKAAACHEPGPQTPTKDPSDSEDKKIGSVNSQQLTSEAADSEEKITNGVAPEAAACHKPGPQTPTKDPPDSEDNIVLELSRLLDDDESFQDSSINVPFQAECTTPVMFESSFRRSSIDSSSDKVDIRPNSNLDNEKDIVVISSETEADESDTESKKLLHQLDSLSRESSTFISDSADISEAKLDNNNQGFNDAFQGQLKHSQNVKQIPNTNRHPDINKCDKSSDPIDISEEGTKEFITPLTCEIKKKDFSSDNTPENVAMKMSDIDASRTHSNDQRGPDSVYETSKKDCQTSPRTSLKSPSLIKTRLEFPDDLKEANDVSKAKDCDERKIELMKLSNIVPAPNAFEPMTYEDQNANYLFKTQFSKQLRVAAQKIKTIERK
ncbi:hypothetical protein EGW08_015123 [Elysia chlorotica]|uniref:Uncharacterized protein n=1 Tax=Elysia chlorotica TaxID=188477 RepID=A0A3S1BC09_ELYCH|nr:hypothetical protein EGW08_015123 [Elysia chlorotica]